jgi:hypothetical protein
MSGKLIVLLIGIRLPNTQNLTGKILNVARKSTLPARSAMLSEHRLVLCEGEGDGDGPNVITFGTTNHTLFSRPFTPKFK